MITIFYINILHDMVSYLFVQTSVELVKHETQMKPKDNPDLYFSLEYIAQMTFDISSEVNQVLFEILKMDLA